MDTKQLIEGLQALTDIADMSDYDCEQFEEYKIKTGSRIEVTFFHAGFTPLMTEQPIVYVSANGKMGTFKNAKSWERNRDKYNVKYWAYQRDIVSGLIME